MSKAIKAILLPAGVNVLPREVEFTDWQDIREFVGGHFDAVSALAKSPTGDDVAIVGYVHDEGMLIGLDDNWLAMAIFRQPLVGDCLIVSGTNPVTGEYDGESYDVPEALRDYMLYDLVQRVSVGYNQTMVVSEALDWAELSGALSPEDLDFLEAELLRLHHEDKGLRDMNSRAVDIVNRSLLELKSFVDDTDDGEED